MVKDLIEKEGVGEAEGGVGFAEVKVDAVEMAPLGGEYFVSWVSFFLSFFTSVSVPLLDCRSFGNSELKI
jgi:hypothetical protein